MNARLAALCRGTGAPTELANTQWQVRAHLRNHRSRKSSCRRESSPLLEPNQPRAKFCSIALQSRAFLVSQVWNETGTGVTPCRLLPARRKHNDLKSQTTSRSQPRRLRHAGWISYSLNRAGSVTAQDFSSGESIIGATEAEPISSAGMVSLGSIGFSLGSPNCGCSTRVASSIAANSNAAAR